MSSATLSSDEAGFSAWLSDMLNRYRRFQSPFKKSQKKFSFPKFSKSDIKKITNANAISGRIFDSVKSISDVFTFDQVSLLNVFSPDIDTETRKLIVVASSIAWIGFDLTETTQKEFYLLFSVLTKCLKEEFCSDYLISLFLISTWYKMLGLSSIQTDDILTFCRAVNNSRIFPNESMHVISILVEIAIKEGDGSSITHLVQSATLLISLNSDELSQYDFSSLIKLCSEGCRKLDVDMLTLLAAVSEISKGTHIIEVYRQLPNTISSAFPDVEFPAPPKPELFEPNKKVILENFSSIEFTKDDDVVFESVAIEDELTTEQLEILGMIQPLISNQSQDATTAFLGEFAAIIVQRDNAPVTLYALFFTMLRTCQQPFASDMLFHVFTTTRVISEEDSYFAGESPFSRLRQYGCEILMSRWPEVMRKILLLYKDKAIIFAELCGRIKQYLTSENATILFNNELIQAISTNTVILINARSESKHAHKAWETLFNFIVSSTKFCGRQFFSDKDFCTVAMLHILSEPLEQSVFIIFKTFLIDAEEEDASTIIGCSAAFLDNSLIPYKCTSILCYHINDCLCENPDLVPSFAKLGKICLAYFIKYPKADGVFVLLTTLAASGYLQVTQEQAIMIGESLRSINKEGIDISEYSPSLSLLAKKKNLSQVNTFLINDPNIIPMIFKIAKSPTKAAQFFMELCEYSNFNCQQAHNGELDMILIEAIRSFPKPFTFAGHEFENVETEEDVRKYFIPLLEKIASISCSDEVGKQLLSLSVPNGDVFPPFSEDILTLINMSLMQKSHDPNTHLEYTKDAETFNYEVKEDLSHGFTFSAWVFLDNPAIDQSTAQPIIVSMDAGGSLIVFFNGESLYCQIQTYNGVSSAVLCQSFPSCKWTLITLVLSPKDPDTAHIIFSLDAEMGQIFIVHNPLNKQEMDFKVGGFTETNPFILKHTSASLGPYTLIKGEVESPESLKIYSRPDDTDGGLLSPIKTQKKSNFVTLTTVASQQSFIDNLMPFFAISGKCPRNFLERVIDVMKVLKMQCNYKLISHMLKTSCGNILTYRTYAAFAELLALSWDPGLLFNVVLDFELWSSCKSSHLVRITSHWSQVIFPTYAEYIMSSMSFQLILSMMREWFWYTPIEGESNGCETRDKNLNVSAVRENINHILYDYAAFNLTPADVCSIISHIVTSPDQLQVFSLLSLLKSVARFVKNRKEAVDSMLSIMETAETKKFMYAFDAYCALTENYEEMPIILDSIDEARGRKMFNALLESKNVSMLHVLFKIAANNGLIIPQENISISDEDAKELNRYKMWYIWPSIYAATLKQKDNYFVMFFVNVFIQNKTLQTLSGVCTTLEATELMLGQKTVFAIDFLKSICEFSSNCNDLIFNDMLLLLCFRFGFFSFTSKGGKISQVLANDFKESPFYEEIQEKEQNQPEKMRFSEIEIFSLQPQSLLFTTEVDFDYVISVRRLLIAMTRIISAKNSDDETYRFIRKIVAYYLKCDTYTPQKKYEKLCSLTPLITQNMATMNKSYIKSFETNIQAIKSKLLKIVGSKEEKIPSEIVSASFIELKKTKKAENIRRVSIEKEWSLFCENSLEKTIWREYEFNNCVNKK